MKTLMATLAAALVFVASAAAQKLELQLDHLIPLAKEHVVIDMDGEQIKAALAAMDAAKVKQPKLPTGTIDVLQVRTFEFENEGAYKPEDVEAIRRQLDGLGMSKIISVREKKEAVDVYLGLKGGAMGGIAVLAVEPKELTVVHILGKLAVNELQALVNSSIAYDLAGLNKGK